MSNDALEDDVPNSLEVTDCLGQIFANPSGGSSAATAPGSGEQLLLFPDLDLTRVTLDPQARGRREAGGGSGS